MLNEKKAGEIERQIYDGLTFEEYRYAKRKALCAVAPHIALLSGIFVSAIALVVYCLLA